MSVTKKNLFESPVPPSDLEKRRKSLTPMPNFVKLLRNNSLYLRGETRMKDRIPDRVFKEIFPKRLQKHQVYPSTYKEIKKMILSGKLKKGID